MFSGRRTPPPVCLAANGSLTLDLRRAIALAPAPPSLRYPINLYTLASISYPYLTSQPKVMYIKKMRKKILRLKKWVTENWVNVLTPPEAVLGAKKRTFDFRASWKKITSKAIDASRY